MSTFHKYRDYPSENKAKKKKSHPHAPIFQYHILWFLAHLIMMVRKPNKKKKFTQMTYRDFILFFLTLVDSGIWWNSWMITRRLWKWNSFMIVENCLQVFWKVCYIWCFQNWRALNFKLPFPQEQWLVLVTNNDQFILEWF